jgi:hypothetical protein
VPKEDVLERIVTGLYRSSTVVERRNIVYPPLARQSGPKAERLRTTGRNGHGNLPAIYTPPAGKGICVWSAKCPHAVALLAIGLVLLGASSWWAATRSARERRSTQALLAGAYNRQRTVEIRLPASPYATVRLRHEVRPAFFVPVTLEAESNRAVPDELP